MKLSLSKPLAFVDLETTGLDVAKDRIVEISILKYEISGEKKTFTRRMNPGIPISAESSEIHGIYDKDVASEPGFKVVGIEIKNFLEQSDLAGYNSNRFDIPMLMEEFYRHEIDFNLDKRRLIDVQNIFHKMEKRTLEAAYKFYCQKELTNAHSAEADVTATAEILESQLDQYSELEPNASFLHQFSAMNKNVDFAGRMIYNDEGEAVFNFGKHKGKLVKEVFEKIDPSYYKWMMEASFTQDTKKKLTAVKLGSL